MDRQNRPGSKPGSGGVASWEDANLQRKARVSHLGIDKLTDLSKDPYLVQNHLGTYECRLCLTLHTNEESYLAHTQGKKHQMNLAKRQSKEIKDMQVAAQPNAVKIMKRRTIKIGRPGYRITKQKDTTTGVNTLLFDIEYPEIETKIKPRFRMMSTYEQHHEPPNDRYQFLLIAAEPYETIAFKVPNFEIDFSEGMHVNHWDETKRTLSLQLSFLPKSNKSEPIPTTFNPTPMQF